MYKKCFAKKGLALVTIALFIGMTAIPIAGDTETEKYADAEHISFGLLNNDEVCVPYFWAHSGENSWFIENVLIWFQYRKDIVETIWYSITEDLIPDWKEYPGDQFYFEEEGNWIFQYKWEDIWGNETVGERISLKIDKTPPEITLNKQIQNLRRQIIFTANAIDVHSEIERVEFWIDGELEANITSGKYEYIFTWEKGKDPQVYDVLAITYNMAGHSNEDNSSTKSLSYPNTHTLINRILQKIQTINLFLFQLLKTIIYVPFNK